ncbi:hypothetical protein PoB_001228200 [Plakobranchus ocellatus]|uniref:Uncharacterized protein n=1 Tax=Plakobranchus ocellatus TaxID=259542 RepID=A0AAV3YUE3_9GAST|nr:hypothetical protein PoB_001228200 [Plakobranchus ocellatus]
MSAMPRALAEKCTQSTHLQQYGVPHAFTLCEGSGIAVQLERHRTGVRDKQVRYHQVRLCPFIFTSLPHAETGLGVYKCIKLELESH